MIQSLLSQHASLRKLLDATEQLINEAYRLSIPFEIGDEVILNGSRGVIAEITYFKPIKVMMYRKDGELSKVWRLVRDMGDVRKV